MELPATVICPATEVQLHLILRQLEEEAKRGFPPFSVFAPQLIHGSFNRGELTVCVCLHSQSVIGFLAGDLLGSGYLYVWPEHRSKGVGTALVEHQAARHVVEGETLLSVEVPPGVDTGFWRRRGFRFKGPKSTVGLCVLPLHLGLGEGTDVDVELRVFNRRPRSSERLPVEIYRPKARLEDSDGMIGLLYRVQMHDNPTNADCAHYVELIVNGKRAYAGKTKGEEARINGFSRLKNGWALDAFGFDQPSEI